MKELDLTKYGIQGATVIAHNPSYEYLFAEETKPELTGYDKGQETESTPVVLLKTNTSWTMLRATTMYGGPPRVTRTTTTRCPRTFGQR